MVSYMGGRDEKGKGGFLLIDGEKLEPKGLWSDEFTPFGYDFWYQPRHDVMVSSEFGTPGCFKNGFNPAEVSDNYGRNLYFWNWSDKKLIKTLDLGPENGLIPLEVRFLHNPAKSHGFVGVALSSTIVHFWKNESGEWVHETVIKNSPKRCRRLGSPHLTRPRNGHLDFSGRQIFVFFELASRRRSSIRYFRSSRA